MKKLGVLSLLAFHGPPLQATTGIQPIAGVIVLAAGLTLAGLVLGGVLLWKSISVVRRDSLKQNGDKGKPPENS